MRGAHFNVDENNVVTYLYEQCRSRFVYVPMRTTLIEFDFLRVRERFIAGLRLMDNCAVAELQTPIAARLLCVNLRPTQPVRYVTVPLP